MKNHPPTGPTLESLEARGWVLTRPSAWHGFNAHTSARLERDGFYVAVNWGSRRTGCPFGGFNWRIQWAPLGQLGAGPGNRRPVIVEDEPDKLLNVPCSIEGWIRGNDFVEIIQYVEEQLVVFKELVKLTARCTVLNEPKYTSSRW